MHCFAFASDMLGPLPSPVQHRALQAEGHLKALPGLLTELSVVKLLHFMSHLVCKRRHSHMQGATLMCSGVAWNYGFSQHVCFFFSKHTWWDGGEAVGFPNFSSQAAKSPKQQDAEVQLKRATPCFLFHTVHKQFTGLLS